MWPGSPMGTLALESYTLSGSQLRVPLPKCGKKEGEGIHPSDYGGHAPGNREVPSSLVSALGPHKARTEDSTM